MAMPSFLNQISRITDNLYLSSFVGTTEYNLLKYKITCVISACRETPKVQMKNVEAIKLEVQDKPTEFLAKYFDFIADKINEVIKKNGIVLVHCVAGISRSTSMILCYLMKHKRMRLRDAHTFVKSKRSFVSWINFNVFGIVKLHIKCLVSKNIGNKGLFLRYFNFIKI